MNHYENLLNELRTVDKRMVRKLDRKRSPPESLAAELWYGKDIPRDKLDWFLAQGGLSYVEGTPMILAIYSQYIGDRALLFTTVGMYAVNSNYEYAGRRFRWEPVTYPIRYADYQDIYGKKDRDGFYSTKIPMVRKNGEQDELYALFYEVFISCILNRCVAYVNQHGPIDVKPTIFRTQAEDDLDWAVSHFCSDTVEPVFPWQVDLRPRSIPASVPEPEPLSSGVCNTSPEAEKKMRELRRYAKEKRINEMLRALTEAAGMECGDALWMIAELMQQADPQKTIQALMLASDAGSQEAAAKLEMYYITFADISRTEHHDYAKWEAFLDRALALCGTDALCYGAGIYLKGEPGIPQDRKKALEFLRLAASRGSRDAMRLLGEAYDAQPEPDLRDEAKKYLAQAAQDGSTEALLLLCKHFGMDSESFRKHLWDSGMAAYATVSASTSKQNVAKAMQYLAVTPREYALWKAAEQRWSEQ